MAASPNIVAYDPNDPTQASFLSALALGESGGSAKAYSLGVGGADLSGTATDAFGFPIWQGAGNSHAAGAFQFEPATWDDLAQKFGLNFANPADQNDAAWILAQQTYAQKTGGNLEDALTAGNFGSIQTALASIWPSVVGNAATPQGIAHDLANGIGSTLPQVFGGVSGGSGTNSDNSSGASAGATGLVGAIENFFVRFGLIIIGAIVIIVALWQLLSSQGVLPSPAQVGKAAAAAL